jgi:hypothetical protein
LACKRPDAPHPLFQGLLGRAGGFLDGLGGFTPRMAMTHLGRHLREGWGRGSPDGGWAVRAAPDSGPLERLLHLASECRQIVWGGRAPTPSQESLPGEPSAQAPEDCLAHGGWAASEGQADAPAGRREALEAERIVQREGHQGVVTLQELGARPWGDGHAARAQRLSDVRDTPVGAVAPLSNEGQDIKAPCMLREGQAPLLCRPRGVATLRPSRVEAAPARERESQDCGQGGDGTLVMVRGPHHLTPSWALAPERRHNRRCGGDRARS